MTCREWNDAIPRHIDPGAGPEERERFESHRDRCGACASYWATYHETIRLARDAYAEPDDEALAAEGIPGLLRAVLESRKPRRG
jgi:anti-sigma factor RsiW